MKRPTLFEEVESGPQFIAPGDIDPGVLYGVQSIDDAMLWQQGAYRVTRREAMSVPAVKRARDLIAGTLGSLPLGLYDANNRPVAWPLLSQPEDRVASTVTWTNVVDDLLFHGHSYLRVTHTGWHGRPVQVVRLEPEFVSIRPDHRTYYTRTGSGTSLEWLPDDQVIRIDSPNDPLLVVGARAIRNLGLLEVAALNAATGVPPSDYFTPSDGVDPGDEEEIEALLTAWQAARSKRRTAYIPASLQYHINGYSPEEIQMSEVRQQAVLEIARLTGIDAEDLSVSTTSRTYANSQDRRRALTDLTLGSYLKAIEGALSMDHVTPRGYKVQFDTSQFIKADDLTTAQSDAVLIQAGILTVNEVRERRGLNALKTTEPPPTPAALPAPAEEEEEEVTADV